MENINEGLLETYLFENNSLIERLDEILLDAEKSAELTSDDVNEIFRSMHTIKGSSAMMEFQPLMEIAHHVEDLFFEIRENGMDTFTSAQKSELFNLLFKCVDRLRDDMGKVERGETLDMDIASFISEIDGFLNASKGVVVAATETEAASSEDTGDLPPLDAPYFLHILLDEDCGMEHLRAFIIITALKDGGLDSEHYPPDVESNPSTAEYIINSGFYVALNSEEDVQSAINSMATLSNIRSYEVVVNPVYQEMAEQSAKNMGAAPAPEAEVKPVEAPTQQPAPTKAPEQAPASIEAQPAAAPPQPSAQTSEISKQLKTLNHAKQSLISVNLSKLDSLMAIVGEIVITESMVTSAPEIQNIKLDGFLKSARQLRKLTDDLQDIAMSLRMVPVSGVFQKMNRIVRDMAKTLNKDVKLTIIGEDTEVDKSIVDNISDPIMHLVRNAMDHGIEKDVNDRIAAGKPAQGEITLSAKHTGSEVVITVENDGADMDTDAIIAKAAKKGLLTKPQSEYSKREILSLLMLPGFSTNAQVTEYSGRGVGLDVVKKNIENLGGSVSISSDPGQGCAFTLKIPLTLAIVGGMEILVGNSVYTIPISNIRQCFKASNSDIILDATGNELISCMGEFVPIVRLANLYNIPNSHENLEDGILMWLESGDKSYCLLVDKLIGEQQVVVKPLPAYLNNFNIKDSGISGCTILGDGNISIILDVGNVFSASSHSN